MKNTIPEGIKKLQEELDRRERYWRDWNGRAANRAARLEAENAELSERYEELRSIIDDGSESMTHEEAVGELKGLKQRELTAAFDAVATEDHATLYMWLRNGRGFNLPPNYPGERKRVVLPIGGEFLDKAIREAIDNG